MVTVQENNGANESFAAKPTGLVGLTATTTVSIGRLGDRSVKLSVFHAHSPRDAGVH